MRYFSETDRPLNAGAQIIREANQVRGLLIESSAEALEASQEVLLRMRDSLAARPRSGNQVDEEDARRLVEALQRLTVLAHQGNNLVAGQLQALLGPSWSARDEAGAQIISGPARLLTEM